MTTAAQTVSSRLPCVRSMSHPAGDGATTSAKPDPGFHISYEEIHPVERNQALGFIHSRVTL